MDPRHAERIRKPSAMQRIARRMSRAVVGVPPDEDEEEAASRVLESRLQLGATAGVALATLLWATAMATDYWFHVSSGGPPIAQNRTGDLFVSSHSGLWTLCKRLLRNGTAIKLCHNHRQFPSSDFIDSNPEVDRTILDYTRTEAAFSIISLCLMLMGLAFSVYTFSQTRYMFKRLAAGIHFFAAASVLVVVEVVSNSVAYEERYLNDRHPDGAYWNYGFSFYLACFTMAILVVCGGIFLFCSRKRKNVDPADGPNIIGR